MDDKDRALLRLLTINAREPVTSLARKTGLARSTVQERIDRLKRRGVISKFTISLAPAHAASQISACIFVKAALRNREEIARGISKIRGLRELYKVTGENDDFLAIVDEANAEGIDRIIGNILALPGVERTSSKILLSRVL